MKERINRLLADYPDLRVCRDAIERAASLLVECCSQGGMILTCGNGGSAADAGHIVGELMKGFLLPRPLPREVSNALRRGDADLGNRLAGRLQQAVRAIDLTAQAPLITAFSNDVAPELVFAQQVVGYGRSGDLLICLSTSGNSQNVVYAAYAAAMLGMKRVGMTGGAGGMLLSWCDVVIRVPRKETAGVQELHLPVYHALCEIVERECTGER